MAFLITTTGTQSPVVFDDLGKREFAHPTSDFDLETEYTQYEISVSNDVQEAIDNGWITVKNEFGDSISKTGKAVTHGDLGGLTKDDHIQYAGTTGNSRVIFSVNSPADGEGLIYNESLSEWVNGTISGGGGSVNVECFDGYNDFNGSGQAIGASWTDMPIDEHRTITSAFSHTSMSPEVTINKTGKYLVMYKVTTMVTLSNTRAQCESRLVLDRGSGYIQVPGSKSEFYNRQLDYGTSSASPMIMDLVAGDKIKVQAMKTMGALSTIIFGDDCSLVIYSLISSGGLFGSELYQAESSAESFTNSTSYQHKLRLTTDTIPAGKYRIGWSAEIRMTSYRPPYIKCRIRLDDTTNISETSENMDASANDDLWRLYTGFGYVDFASDDIHDIDIDFCASQSGTQVGMRNARLEIWRVA